MSGPSKTGIGPEGVAALILLAVVLIVIVGFVFGAVWLTGLVLDAIGYPAR